MYRIVLTCSGVPIDEGAEAASDITNGFRVHRAWHNNVSCQWDGAQLILQAENDFDSLGSPCRINSLTVYRRIL